MTDQATIACVEPLLCSCCDGLTYGRQWWNRDAGFGLCVDCVDFVSRGQTPEWVLDSYGERGVHYDVPE